MQNENQDGKKEIEKEIEPVHETEAQNVQNIVPVGDIDEKEEEIDEEVLKIAKKEDKNEQSVDTQLNELNADEGDLNQEEF